jgi:GNAT superfamily N-acetyltransferase
LTPSHQIRPFQRSDREQLADLVNAHASAVVPGMATSVASLLLSLERDPAEVITSPWVTERMTLVAEQQHRVVAAAHLLRYGDHKPTGENYLGVGQVEWLVFWPEAPSGNPYWADATQAAETLMASCLSQFENWGAARQRAEGDLPVPCGVYGVPEQWPHVRALYERAGFSHTGQTEVVHLARVRDIPRPTRPPLPGLELRRSVGMNGTRLSAYTKGTTVGYVEVETRDKAERLSPHGRWADVGNLAVQQEHRRHGVASWLLGEAAEWLELAGAEHLLDYTYADSHNRDGVDPNPYQSFLSSRGFRELTRTCRGWTREPSGRSG